MPGAKATGPLMSKLLPGAQENMLRVEAIQGERSFPETAREHVSTPRRMEGPSFLLLP